MAAPRALLLLGLALALCCSASGKGLPETDRDILVRFRDSIPNFAAARAGGSLEGWDDGTPTFLWGGVVLDFDMRVREINLECFDWMACNPTNISTETDVFAELATLEHLETLHLGGNVVMGPLPDAWAQPGAFPRLQSLSITWASLSCTLPASWGTPGAFPALKQLALQRNQLRGSLPASWAAEGAFPSLEELMLGDNDLTGSLPESWGRGPAFPRLRNLVLEGSGVFGALPAAWGGDGGFPSLEALFMGKAGLHGSLPPEWGAPGRFARLDKLMLGHNLLTGSLPPAWGCEECLPSLTQLLLVNNSLSGPLPGAWGALRSLNHLELGGNALTGSLPEAWGRTGALPQLQALIAYANRLNGSLPASWAVPGALPTLSVLFLPENRFSGTLPREWGQPNSFPRLRELNLDSNNLTGPLPGDWQLNVTLQQLVSLSLANNSLTGSLPSSWGALDGALTALAQLNLGFNQLTGSVPPSWGSSRSALSSLSTLVVAGNNITGEVPPSLGLLPSLRYLILAPGNPTVCRALPYVGEYVTCFGAHGGVCEEPVQLRSNCSDGQPGWVPYRPSRRPPPGFTGLQIALIAAGASMVAAAGLLGATLVLRWRERRRWQAVKGGMDAELSGRDGADALGDLLAAAAARKRGRPQHSALAIKLLKECAIDQADIMFCRGPDGNLVQLGSGAYGQVYKAFLYGVHPVAVKVFATQDDVPADDFWREISILRTCRHSNIVQFQGACVDGDTTMMVTELMDTDLYRALQAGRVSWYNHGLDIAIDVAQALHFLHCRSIIHFDCKSPNILLSTTNQAKLADVGWAQILYHSYITGDGGTFNWAAPEQLIGLKCTAKADVYSYGLVLWELCTRELPVRGQIRDVRVPEEAPQAVVDLIRECLNVDPARRPSMEQIIRRLQAEKERMAEEAGAPLPRFPAPRPPSSSGPGSSSSLGLRGLDGLPGRSVHQHSGSGSGGQAGTGSGERDSGSVWRASESRSGEGGQSGSGAARQGSEVGAGAGANPFAGAGAGAAGGSVLARSSQPIAELPPAVGGVSAAASAWDAGTSGAGGSSQGEAGAQGGIFAASPWFQGASLASSSEGSGSGGSSGGAGRSTSPTSPPAPAGPAAAGPPPVGGSAWVPVRSVGIAATGPMPFRPSGPPAAQHAEPLGAGNAQPPEQAEVQGPPVVTGPIAGPQGPSIFANSPWFTGTPFAAVSGSSGASGTAGSGGGGGRSSEASVQLPESTPSDRASTP